MDHQRLTIENYLELRNLAPELPFVPVLQGWERDDYLRHAEMYDAAGVDLFRENPVGIGSVCRRQGMKEAQNIVWAVASQGLRLHGYGFKTEGLKRFGFDLFASSDSMSWSTRARNIAYHDEPNPIRCPKHKSCANCLDFALWWRDDLLGRRRPIQQLHLGAA